MPRSSRDRTWFTTLLGVVSILGGAPASLFSLFALLLAIGKPYANASTTAAAIFLLFVVPPATLLAGIGLLARWRWARWWMILLMAGLVALGVKGLVAADHEGSAIPVAGIAIGGLVLSGLLSGPVRREFGKTVPPHPPAPPAVVENEELGWRVGHRGRDQMFYEEHHDGAWQRIEIDGEMLTGPAHHVIYFADEETWRFYPEWARHRRDEIIARVKSRFREPDYEYAGGGRAKVAQPDPVVTPVPHGPAGLSKNDGTILPALVFLLAIGSASLWFAWRGMETGETRLPMKHNPLRRTITRADDPALFWTSIGLAGGFGGGCVVLSAWMVGARFRRGR